MELEKAWQWSPQKSRLDNGKNPWCSRLLREDEELSWEILKAVGGVFLPVKWNATLPGGRGMILKNLPWKTLQGQRYLYSSKFRACSSCLTNMLWILTSKDTYPTKAEIVGVLSLATWRSSNPFVLFNDFFDLLLQQVQPQGWTFLLPFFFPLIWEIGKYLITVAHPGCLLEALLLEFHRWDAVSLFALWLEEPQHWEAVHIVHGGQCDRLPLTVFTWRWQDYGPQHKADCVLLNSWVSSEARPNQSRR